MENDDFKLICLSKNVIGIVLCAEKKWIYHEYDVHNFKKLKELKVNKIFQKKNIRDLKFHHNLYISLNNRTHFKTSKYVSMKKYQANILAKLGKIKLEGHSKDLSLQASVKIFQDPDS
jgi:hypothetical protein